MADESTKPQDPVEEQPIVGSEQGEAKTAPVAAPAASDAKAECVCTEFCDALKIHPLYPAGMFVRNKAKDQTPALDVTSQPCFPSKNTAQNSQMLLLQTIMTSNSRITKAQDLPCIYLNVVPVSFPGNRMWKPCIQ